jgi:hypothetical protein
MLVDDRNQASSALASWLLATRGFRRDVEVPLSLIFGQAHINRPRETGVVCSAGSTFALTLSWMVVVHLRSRRITSGQDEKAVVEWEA